ncbi:hypothetical protein R70723_27720 [Paenibacillus sp. FSL R7-0273]|uniref:DUF1453 family protein n=1 Tax=Paenibacillus sp. FSL R7-0273 TaxID=1536772 RepID=UPI0004F687FD|nr:DUF1453 family protein [Paenibacillus sp. FSL R7-0273]AIQ49268.1 hypothetical protein R70723_27720 [Paenibacillus sp. FSL R7-0273]OMF87161.1 hypothetical protein BK144_24290 [Paenibacillus sp. FSL R7-0273]
MHVTVQQVISSTPAWVWALLAALIIMGLRNSQEKPVNFIRMLIAPLIFMIWGLWTLTTKFDQVGYTLMSYILFIIPGFVIGYLLNKAFQSFAAQAGIIYKKQSYLPLIVVLINFAVKYALNVMLVFYHSTLFHLIYSAANGLTVGLFFGGILYTLKMQTELRSAAVR